MSRATHDLDRLRLAAALVHVVPGASLELHGADGTSAIVATHPSADLAPCAFRAAVAAAGPGGGQPVTATLRLDHVTIGGSVSDLGGGVVATATPCGLEQRWVVTTLSCVAAAAILQRLGDTMPTDTIEATVAPDAALGVCVVVLTATASAGTDVLDRLASELAIELVVEELVESARSTATSDSDR